MTERSLSRSRRGGGIFLLCTGLLMYELALTRVFSVLMWYHFASMAISLALFGMGVAALLVYLRPGWFPVEATERRVAQSCTLFAVSLALFFGIFVLFRLAPHLAFKVLATFHQPFYQPFQQGFEGVGLPAGLLPVLVALYLVTALPFFFGGLAVTLLFSRYLAEIGRLYFWDLLGAGTGCLGIIVLLKLVGGISALPLIALCGLAAAWCFVPGNVLRRGALALLLLGLALGNLASDFAEIRFVRGRYEPHLLWSAWNSFSRVAVYPSQSQEMERAWGLSRTYRGPIPEQLGMVVDDTGYTTLYRAGDAEHAGFFRDNVIALPYLLKEQPRALVIGPGGGKDVRAALAGGAAHVTAVEINPLIVQAVNEEFGPFTGELYRRPEVEAVVAEGRHFVHRSTERFDVIQASAVFGRMPPAAGAFTLSENNLYTLEAFRDYWEHLEDDGILSISRFIFERESLRLVSLGVALLNELGVADPGAHIAVIRERGLANFMLKRSPFSPEEIDRLRAQARAKAFDVVFLPDRRDGDDPYHQLIASRGSAAFHAGFPFDITPTSDDRPFFYYMLRPGDFLSLFAFPDKSPFEDRAILILRNLLLAVAGLVAVCMLGPLLLWQRRALREPGTALRLGYFAAIGLGFMFLEIGLLRRFTLFLGHPIYALAVVLFALLVFTGLGSLAADRSLPGGERRLLGKGILALVLLVIGYLLALPPLLAALMGLALPLRALLAVLLLAPLGLLLGLPLPLGMRHFHRDPQAVPWSWGINSATSVLGALLAAVVAMNYGFNLTLVAGGLLYLLALAAALGRRKA